MCAEIEALKARIGYLEDLLKRLPVQICEYSSSDKDIIYSNYAETLDGISTEINEDSILESSPGVLDIYQKFDKTMLFCRLHVTNTRPVVFDSYSPALAWQFTVDEVPRITYVNECFVNWVKQVRSYEPKVGDLLLKHSHKLSIGFVRELMDKVLKTEGPVPFEQHFHWVQSEYQPLKGVYLMGTMYPIRNKNGEIIEAIMVARDISKALMAVDLNSILTYQEKIAKETQRRMEYLASFSHTMALQFTLDLKLTFMSDSASVFVNGIMKQHFEVGKNIETDNCPEIVDCYHSKVEQVRQNMSKYEYETEIPTEDGKMIYLVCCMLPIYDENGNWVEVLQLLRDVTEERHAANEKAALIMKERLASESSKQKGEFLVHMSHELRTPLTGLLGLYDLLCSELEMTAEQTIMADEAKKSGEMLLHIINDILDLSKIEAGKLEIEYLPFKVTELIEMSCQVNTHALRKNKIPLVADVDADLHGVFIGDCLRLQQVLTNLISNAIKFSRNKGIGIRVQEMMYVPKETENDRKLILFTVEDEGIGIKSDIMQRLFKNFTQADVSTQRKYGGTGLGLAIAEKLTMLMGGCIGCESKVDVGSKFWFYIPLPVKKSKISLNGKLEVNIMMHHRVIQQVLSRSTYFINDAKSALTISESSGEFVVSSKEKELVFSSPLITWQLRDQILSKPDEEVVKHKTKVVQYKGRVLVVDDNYINIKVLTLMLQKAGLETKTAENGKVALEIFEQDTGFDMIFMDCLMPEMDGYEASTEIRRIEKIENRKRIPIVAITANSLKEDMDRCFDSGMDEYLTKPFQNAKVNSTLSKFLQVRDQT